MTLSFLLFLNNPFYLPTMSPLTPESINSGFIIPPRLSRASSSTSNIQPINTDVDSCYSQFILSFAGSASLFPNSRLLPDSRPIARSTLKRQKPSSFPTPSLHMDKDISAITQPPVSIKLHRGLLIVDESRGDAREVSRVSEWTIQIDRAKLTLNPHLVHKPSVSYRTVTFPGAKFWRQSFRSTVTVNHLIFVRSPRTSLR